MQFEEFLFLCGVSICCGLCITFGGLLGIGLFAAVREVFKRS
jgi:hypothetical protein